MLAGFRQRQLVRKERRWQDFRQREREHQAFFEQGFMQQAIARHGRALESLELSPPASSGLLSVPAKAAAGHEALQQMVADMRAPGVAIPRMPRPPWTWERGLGSTWALAGLVLAVLGAIIIDSTDSPHPLAGLVLFLLGMLGIVTGVMVMSERRAGRTWVPMASSAVVVVVAELMTHHMEPARDRRLFGLLPELVALVTAVLAFLALRFPADPTP